MGFCIIAFVLWNAEPAVKVGGLVWLAIGLVVMAYHSRKGIGILPELPLTRVPGRAPGAAIAPDADGFRARARWPGCP
jgi:hypothetical protein